MSRVVSLLKRIPIWAVYVTIAVGMVLSYQFVRAALIIQDAWILVIRSSVTLNFVLLLFLWGVTVDKWTKNMPKQKGWLLWGIGFAVIIIAYKFIGGYRTIFELGS